jgi:hypothetical protein
MGTGIQMELDSSNTITPSLVSFTTFVQSLRRIKGHTRMHVDGMTSDMSELRNMSIIIALNDDYEGCEICFPEQSVTIKLKKG